MKKSLLVFLVMTLVIATTVNAEWVKGKDPKWAAEVFADTSLVSGGHGIVVDKYDRIWSGSYYDVGGIRVLDQDKVEASFSPISGVTIGDTTIVVSGGNCRGMNVDHEGNILYAMGATLIKINVEDGTGMAHWSHSGSLLKPAVDQDGYIYCGMVVGVNPVVVLDPATFDVSTEIELPGAPSYARGLVVSADGKTIIPSVLAAGPVKIYHSDDWVTYTLSDSIYIDKAGNDIFKHQCTTVDWGPDGKLWISHDGAYGTSGEIDNGFVVVDLENSTFGYVYMPMDSTEYNGPRGIAFSSDGYAYATSFNGNKIWKLTPGTKIATSNWKFDADLAYYAWEYDTVFADTSLVSGGHGIVVDKYDRIWSGSYYDVGGIRVLDQDKVEASFSPISEVTIGDTTIVVSGGNCRGMNVDHEGNILYAMGATLIKINVEDGTGMAHWSHSGSLLKPAVDQDGYIYCGMVVGVNPVVVLDPATFDVSTEIELPGAPSYARGLEVSADGKTIIPSVLAAGPVKIYHSDDWVTYTLADSIFGDVDGDPIFKHQCTTVDWGPDGKLWISHDGAYGTSGEIDNGFVVVDLDAKKFDYVAIPMDSTEYNGPRGIAFSSDGYAYATSFNGNKIYRLKLIGTSGVVDGNPVTANVPKDFQLMQNYPNPFNPTTKIDFKLSKSHVVKLVVYDILGREVKVIVNDQRLVQGPYSYEFDASNLATGIYLYRLTVGNQHVTKKMTIVK